MNLIDMTSYPIKDVLPILLKDKTTKQNIVFATGSYEHLGPHFQKDSQMDAELLFGINAAEIQPRVAKPMDEQMLRTRKKAEVFTPSWIVNGMNNYCDEEWFGKADVFNIMDGEIWHTKKGKIEFPEGKTWKDYVDSKRLEITCGEAPYLVSRYDTTTGQIIPIRDRIGLLDRKLRVVGENTDTKDEWLKWAVRAFQSVYGFEWQGDSLLIARINHILTFTDYMKDKWDEAPTKKELSKLANIISWNLWQMDGLSGTIPYKKQKEMYHQVTVFEWMDIETEEETERIPCRIYDWRSNESVEYNSIKKG